MNEPRIAVYLGTFDPITLGHLDVISRGAVLFDHLIVGVGHNKGKTTRFSTEKRVELVHAAVSQVNKVQVEAFSGLAVDFARKVGACAMLRGLRTEADFIYEMQMALMNRNLAQGLETVFIPTRQDLSHISSSMIKEVAELGGDVSSFVPSEVNELFVKA